MKSNRVGSAREAFARAVRALEPYAAEVVLIGGWVHALLLASASERSHAVLTDDIDFTIPRKLLTAGRPTLVELATQAGFELDPLSELDGAPSRLTVDGPRDTVIDLDILTEGDQPRSAVPIEGQPDLAAQGYPGQTFLQTHTQWVSVGTDIHQSLDPPVRIRIPTVGAYVIHKGLSSSTRAYRGKEAKDLVYLFEILRHPNLGQSARAEIRDLHDEDPTLIAAWRDRIEEVLTNSAVLREMAAQLLLAGRFTGADDDAIARIRAVLRRAVEDHD